MAASANNGKNDTKSDESDSNTLKSDVIDHVFDNMSYSHMDMSIIITTSYNHGLIRGIDLKDTAMALDKCLKRMILQKTSLLHALIAQYVINSNIPLMEELIVLKTSVELHDNIEAAKELEDYIDLNCRDGEDMYNIADVIIVGNNVSISDLDTRPRKILRYLIKKVGLGQLIKKKKKKD
jgi:hypothetical protein